MAENSAPTFVAGDGRVATDFPGSDYAQDVAVQSDGRILVAGGGANAFGYDFSLLRYNADGSLDTSFDSDGIVMTPVGASHDYGSAMVVQTDGKILVAGSSLNAGGDYDFALVRYNADGSLDTSFDGDGKVTTAIGTGDDSVSSMALQADGKIVVAGASLVAGKYQFAVVRYNANGSLDTTFSGDGKLTTALGTVNDLATGVAIQADGRIVVAGSSYRGNFAGYNDFAVVRYNANGTLDTSFDGDGKVTTAVGTDQDQASAVALQPDGKILVGGTSFNSDTSHDFALVRYNTNGSLDTTFDADGKVTTSFFSDDEANALVLQPDGRIVLAGDSFGNSGIIVARYNGDGSLDPTLDGDGKFVAPVVLNEEVRDAAVQPDGRILITGFVSIDGPNILELVRLLPEGTFDPTFDRVNSLNGTPVYTENGAAVVLDADVRVYDSELLAQGHYGGATLELERHGGANGDDVFSSQTLGALAAGSAVIVSGVTVGTVTANAGGTLLLAFNGSATQARLDAVLQSLAYSNRSDAPPTSVQIEWTFSDGNTGTQGTGGERSATGSTTVTVETANDWPTFRVGGRVTTTFAFDDMATGIAIQPDGRILVAGETTFGGGSDFAILRYRADGTLDTTFSGDGKATTSFNAQDQGRDIELQGDGKVIVAGVTASDPGHGDFALVRYNADGSPDTTFDGDGKVTTNFPHHLAPDSSSESIFETALQSDGKIVAVGEYIDDVHFDFAVARYNTDGSLDTSFDTDGMLVTDFLDNEFARAVAVQSDGKIVVAGYTIHGEYDFAVARYNTDGSLDTSFDTDGKRVIDLGSDDAVYAMALQADGKILLAGVTGNQNTFAVVRLNANGSFDTSFSGDGIVRTAVGTLSSAAFDIAVQPDGRIVVVGRSSDGGPSRFTVVRYNANGSLDTSFDGDGIATAYGGGAGALGVALQSDGRIVAVGHVSGNFATVRYNSDGTLDATFGPPSDTLNGSPTFLENGAPVVMDGDVRVYDAELAAQGHYDGATLTLARRLEASAQDVFSATGPLAALTQGAALSYSGVDVGTVTTNTGGTLVLTFNANATQARVDGVLQAIAYSNTSEAPPLSVNIFWTFSDGGDRPAIERLNVKITPTTDTYLWSSLANGQVIEFDPGSDRLRFDDASISAADVSVTAGSAIFSHGGKTITLQTTLGSITTSSVIFDGSGKLIVGDNNAATDLDIAGDTVAGEAGNDRLMGLGGNDTLNGADGADALDGGTEADALDGGPGFDFASYVSAASGVTARLYAPASNAGDAAGDTYISIEGLTGSNFIDVLGGDSGPNELQGLDGTDSLYGRDGADTLKGGAGKDNLYGDAGTDALDGGADFDWARYDTAPAGVRADLGGAITGLGDAAGDTFTLVEGLVGSAFDDTLLGDALANTLQGRDGTDSLYGRAGADTLQGGAGGDNLYGEAGADALDGGADLDWARYDTAPAGVRADLSGAMTGTGDAAGDTFTLIERLVGSGFNDQLFGDALANTLQGRDGADTLVGRGGKDTLQGGNGNDDLDGGAGQDLLLGDAGNDTFRFKVGEANGDRVQDFNGNGVLAGDALVFQGYGLGATFIQTSPTTGEIRYAITSVETLTFVTPTVVGTDYTFI